MAAGILPGSLRNGGVSRLGLRVWFRVGDSGFWSWGLGFGV